MFDVSYYLLSVFWSHLAHLGWNFSAAQFHLGFWRKLWFDPMRMRVFSLGEGVIFERKTIPLGCCLSDDEAAVL